MLVAVAAMLEGSGVYCSEGVAERERLGAVCDLPAPLVAAPVMVALVWNAFGCGLNVLRWDAERFEKVDGANVKLLLLLPLMLLLRLLLLLLCAFVEANTWFTVVVAVEPGAMDGCSCVRGDVCSACG